MTSYHRRDYPEIKSLTHQFCCNQMCNNIFSVTEDIRQKYCCKLCSAVEASRRKNARKRIEENRRIFQEEIALLSRPMVKIDPMAVVQIKTREDYEIDPTFAQIKAKMAKQVENAMQNLKASIISSKQAKEALMNKRTYSILYNDIAKNYVVIFQDSFDPMSEFCVEVDIPPFTNHAAIKRVVDALNEMAEK